MVFTVQFGIGNVLNITYGAPMTFAAYLGYTLLAVGVGIWAALAIVAVAIAVASVAFTSTAAMYRYTVGWPSIGVAGAAGSGHRYEDRPITARRPAL